jgi:hypothetical protein
VLLSYQLHVQRFWAFEGKVDVETDFLSILQFGLLAVQKLTPVDKDLLTRFGDNESIVFV